MEVNYAAEFDCIRFKTQFSFSTGLGEHKMNMVIVSNL